MADRGPGLSSHVTRLADPSMLGLAQWLVQRCAMVTAS